MSAPRPPAAPGSSPRVLLTAVVALVAVGGCVPEPATAEGRAVVASYVVFLVAAAVVAAVVIVPTTYAIVRHRRRRDELPPQTRGHVGAEAIWTVLPALLIGGLFVVTLLTLFRVEANVDRPGADVRVTAFRWGWTIDYPEADVSISGIGAPGPEIVVPVREPVRFTLTGADVQHAFYVPAFLTKRDAIPGRENTFTVTIEEPGTYRGQCAEFCGTYHSKMPFAVRAVPRGEYEAWLAEQAAAGSPQATSPLGSPLATSIPDGPGETQPAQPLESAP